MKSSQERAMKQAREVADRAHAPYSSFRVGAVAIAADGSCHRGCNVENAAYGATICAEANALSSAVAAGSNQIDTVVVAGLDTDGPCYPCGNCRQLMRELGVRSVVVEDGHGGLTEHSLEELLPHAFGPEDLD